jgi:hypothetical protein
MSRLTEARTAIGHNLSNPRTRAKAGVLTVGALLAGCLGLKLAADFITSINGGAQPTEQPQATSSLAFGLAGGGEEAPTPMPPTATLEPIVQPTSASVFVMDYNPNAGPCYDETGTLRKLPGETWPDTHQPNGDHFGNRVWSWCKGDNITGVIEVHPDGTVYTASVKTH